VTSSAKAEDDSPAFNGKHWIASLRGRSRFGLDSASQGPILNHMVYFSSAALDRTFAALSDPTRRALVAQLSECESLSVSELAKPFAMSLPAVMKHLDVLTDAGLLTREKTGRTVSCRLRAEPMRDANEWLERYQRFWSESLDRLAAHLEEEDACPPQPPSSPVSPSAAASRRPLRASTGRGRSRRK
jgi:DNA-binding transcriptional ArsR family regulator